MTRKTTGLPCVADSGGLGRPTRALDTSLHAIREEALPRFGFARAADGWALARAAGVGALTLRAAVTGGRLVCSVYDADGTEYTLYLVESARGAFVGAVRQAVEDFRQSFLASCCEREAYRQPDARALVAWIRESYGDGPEFLWRQYPTYGAVRRADTGKWYALFMAVPPRSLGLGGGDPVEVLNVRAPCAAALVDGRRYFPAYHMSKRNWVTARLDAGIPLAELKGRIDASHALADPRKGRTA